MTLVCRCAVKLQTNKTGDWLVCALCMHVIIAASLSVTVVGEMISETGCNLPRAIPYGLNYSKDPLYFYFLCSIKSIARLIESDLVFVLNVENV